MANDLVKTITIDGMSFETFLKTAPTVDILNGKVVEVLCVNPFAKPFTNLTPPTLELFDNPITDMPTTGEKPMHLDGLESCFSSHGDNGYTSYDVWVPNHYRYIKEFLPHTVQCLDIKLSRNEQMSFDTLRQLCMAQLEKLFTNKPVFKRSCYRTQKVTGFLAYVIGSVVSYPTHVLPYHIPVLNGEVFARPCPTRPRHGFVESKIVSSYTELLELYSEALQHDLQAEVMIMTPLMGGYSAVATNAGITFGKGNDGVTNGTGGVTIPVMTSLEHWNEHNATTNYKEYGIENCAYIELVGGVDPNYDYYGDEKLFIVQRRDGPEQTVNVDFVPHPVTVKSILSAGNAPDLLYWEEKIKTNAGKKGVVVSLEGHSLSSHWAVHAIANNIPVITSYRPELGQTIAPITSSQVPSLTERDIYEIKRHLKKFIREKYRNKLHIEQDLLSTAVASIHAMARWDNTPHLLKLRAFGVEILLRFLHSAIAGEFRHWDHHGPGLERETSAGRRIKPRKPCTRLKTAVGAGMSRESVYKYYLRPLSIKTRHRSLLSLVKDFEGEGWDRGYGGQSWANVANATARIADTIQRFLVTPDVETWKTIVMAANVALHTAHNNGVAVNKWIGGSDVDRIAIVPTLGFMNPIAAKLVLDIPLTREKK